jgi:hypothetical protein
MLTMPIETNQLIAESTAGRRAAGASGRRRAIASLTGRR